jgi:hypothetical protein
MGLCIFQFVPYFMSILMKTSIMTIQTQTEKTQMHMKHLIHLMLASVAVSRWLMLTLDSMRLAKAVGCWMVPGAWKGPRVLFPHLINYFLKFFPKYAFKWENRQLYLSCNHLKHLLSPFWVRIGRYSEKGPIFWLINKNVSHSLFEEKM